MLLAFVIIHITVIPADIQYLFNNSTKNNKKQKLKNKEIHKKFKKQ